MHRRKAEPAQRRFSGWSEQVQKSKVIQKAEELSLRRDMVTLLGYVQKNKVIGTQSTGNMPLKAVREVTALFVNPPQLDSRIGDRVYRLRSEADIWPLYFLHILAQVGELVWVEPGRRWQVTPGGERFLDKDPFFQTSFMLTTWWYRVNWLVAYPYEGMGEDLPDGFQEAALKRLRGLLVGQRVPFEEFADGLIDETGLTWTVQVDSARMFLQSSINRMIVCILTDFGAVEPEYEEEPLGKGTRSKLVAFQVTPFGRALLGALMAVSQSLLYR